MPPPVRISEPVSTSAGLPSPRRALQARGAAQRRTISVKLVAFGLAAGLVTPVHVTLPFESPKITVMRGVLLLLIIPAGLTFLRGLGSRRRRFRLSDLFMLLLSFWIILALAVTEGLSVAAVSGSLAVLELLGGYLVMRAYFTSRVEAEIFLKYFGRAVAIIIAGAVIDHIMGYNFLSNTTAQIFGKTFGPSDYRNGLLRATSTMEHPILYGTICAFAFVLLYYGTKRLTARIGYMALCAFGCVLAMSSAPLLSLILGCGLISYDFVLRSFAGRWKLLLSSIALFIVMLVSVKNDPVATLIRNFTIDPQTGFYRLMIWQYAGAAVLNSPLVGIGKAEWARIPGMNGSVDTIWLTFALAYGIPASVLLGLSMLASMKRAGLAVPEKYLDPYLTGVRRGLSVTLSLAIFTGFTVHFWGVMLTLLGLLAGLRTTLEESRAREVQKLLQPQRRPANVAQWRMPIHVQKLATMTRALREPENKERAI